MTAARQRKSQSGRDPGPAVRSAASRFFGLFKNRALDTKRRVFMPAQLRDDSLTQTFLLVADPGRSCVIGFYQDAPPFDEETIAAIAPFSFSVPLDKHNSLLLDKALIDFLKARENEGLTLAGCGAYFEIWTPGEWDKQESLRHQQAAALLEAGIKTQKAAVLRLEGPT